MTDIKVGGKIFLQNWHENSFNIGLIALCNGASVSRDPFHLFLPTLFDWLHNFWMIPKYFVY